MSLGVSAVDDRQRLFAREISYYRSNSHSGLDAKWKELGVAAVGEERVTPGLVLTTSASA